MEDIKGFRINTADGAYDYSKVGQVQLSQIPQVQISEPKVGVKEKRELENKRLDEIAANAALEARDQFLSSDKFNNFSLFKKKEAVNNYLTTTLQDYIKTADIYKQNTGLDQKVTRAVRTELNKIIQREQDAINEASGIGAMYGEATTSASQQFNNFKNYVEQGLNSPIKAEYDDLSQHLANIPNLRKELQQNFDNILSGQLTDKSRAHYEAMLKQNLEQMDKDEANTKKRMQELYVPYIKELAENASRTRSMREALAQEEDADVKANAYRLDMARRERELAEDAIARGEEPGFGVVGNERPIGQIMRVISKQTPQIAAQLGAATLGGAAGGLASGGNPVGITAGATAGLMLMGAAQGATDVGMQAFEQVMSAKDDVLKKAPDYDRVYNAFKKLGMNDKEAAEYTKYQLAMTAFSEAAPMGAAIESALSAFGPESTFVKGSIINTLFSQGILKGKAITKYLEKVAAGGAEEFASEGAGQAAANIATNIALDSDIPVSQGVLQAGVMGAELGAGIGGAGALYRGTVDTLASRTDNTAQRQQPTQTTSAAAQQQTLGTQQGATPTAQPTQATVSTQTQAAPVTPQTATQQTTTPTAQTAQQATATVQTTQTPAPMAQNATIGTTPVATDTNSQFYNPQRAQTITNSQAMQDMMNLNDDLLSRNRPIDSVQDLESADIQKLSSIVSGLRLAGDTNDYFIKQWLNNLKNRSNVNIDYDDLMNSITQSLASQVSANGAPNGTITRANQGAANASGSAANTQSAATSTARQQNTAVITGSGQATQSPGFSWAPYTNTRTPAQDVQFTQPLQTTTGQGAISGRNNTANDTTGTQSDLRSGSTAGTTEQRTVDGGSTETNGAGAAQSSITQQVPQAGTSDLTNALETGARLAEQDETIDPEIRAREERVYRRAIAVNVNRMSRQVQQDRLINKHKKALMESGQDEVTADFNSTLLARIQIGIAQITGTYLDLSVVPFTPNERTKFNGPALNEKREVVPGYTTDNVIHLGDPAHLETVPHEVMHAVVNHIAKIAGIIKLKAKQGDVVARQFIEDWTEFCKAMGLKADDYLDPEFLRRTSTQETIAISMEGYVKNGKFPNDTGLSEKYQPMAQRMRLWFEGLVNALHEYVRKFTAEYNAWMSKRGKDTPMPLRLSRRETFIKRYADPRRSVYSSELPAAANNFFDKLVGGVTTYVSDMAQGTNATAQTQAVIDATAQALTNDYILAGIPADQAVALADNRMRSAVRYAFATDEQRAQMLQDTYENRKRQAMETNPDLVDAVGDEHLDNPILTQIMGTDADLINAQFNNDVESEVAQTFPSPIMDALSSPSDPAPLIGIAPAEEEAQLVEQTASEIETVLSEGQVDNDADVQEKPWFERFFMGGGITDENGNPRLFYRVGNMLSPSPFRSEIETSSYGRTTNPITGTKDFFDKVGEGMTDRQKSYYEQLLGRIVQDFRHNRYVELSYMERKALSNLGFDSIVLKMDANTSPHYLILDSNNISDFYQMNHERPDDPFLDPLAEDVELYDEGLYYSVAIKPNTTVQDLLNINGKMVNDMMVENSQALLVQKADKLVSQAGIFSESLLPSQEASWWNNIANLNRKLWIDDKTAIRQWFENKMGMTHGEAAANLAYIEVTISPNKVRGTKTTIDKNITLKIRDWIDTVAKDHPEITNPEVFGKDGATIYRDLSIIEAAGKQENRLVNAVSSAMTIVEPSERAAAIKEARDQLDAFRARQGGADNGFPIDGGMTIDECMEELNTLTAKYDDTLILEALNRIRQGIRDMVLMNIENGIYSEEYVNAFGRLQYYMPFTTLTDYETTRPDDVVSAFPAKMDRQRKGANTPAVDALSALDMLGTKSANAIGAYKAGQNLVGAYQLLEQRLQSGDKTVKVAEEHIHGKLKARYLNGLAIIPYDELEAERAKADTFTADEIKNKYIDNAAFIARPLIETPDGKTKTKPYLVIFNLSDLNATDGTVMKSNEQVNTALRSMFTVDIQKPNFISKYIGRPLARTTSAIGSMFTTYIPLFSPMNAVKDIEERLPYAIASTYVADDGSTIDGSKIALQATLNLRYAPEIMQTVINGKPENIPGKLGQYLTEFEQQGIMNTASVRAMLKNIGDTNYAYLEKLAKDSNSENFFTNAEEMRKTLRGKAHTWSEMWYAVPTFIMYKAFRDSGMSPDRAAYHVNEMMNLKQRGIITKKLNTVIPYIGSIAQTAGQLSKFAGFDTVTFGHQRSFDKEFFKNRAKASGLFLGFSFVVVYPVIAGMAEMMGTPDDPEKGRRYFGTMDVAQFTSLPIPITDDFTVKGPLGFGPLAWAAQLALATYQVLSGYKKPTDVGTELVFAYYRSMSPVAGPVTGTGGMGVLESMALSMTPPIVQPIVDNWLNRDYFGNKIDYASENLRESERASDIDLRFTEQGYKDIAKWFYDVSNGRLDYSPEKWKHTFQGYAFGPLRAVLDAIMKDPVLEDPEFKSVRDELGPWATALGASSWFGTVNKRPRAEMSDAMDFYESIIKEAGVADLLKGKGGSENTLASHIKEAMVDMGFDVNAAYDYAELRELENDLKQLAKKARAEMEEARNSGAGTFELRSINQNFIREYNDMIRNTMEGISIYNGTVKRVDVRVPSEQEIRLYRSGR